MGESSTGGSARTAGGSSSGGLDLSRARRAHDRRRAAEDALLDAFLLPQDGRAEAVGSESQALLVKALARLQRQEGVAAVVAWGVDAEGTPHVLAAQPAHSANRIQVTRELYRGLSTLSGPSRLCEADGILGPELAALAARGVSAIAPVAGLGSSPAAMLLLFSEIHGRVLRPRVFAVLSEVARKLTETMSTHLALGRLGRLDGAVQRLDRLAALGSLVAEIVHEIRNPLVSVKTFLQLLPERLEDPDFHEDFRLVVSDEVRRLERMLEDLLRQARPAATADPGDGAHIASAIETTIQILTYRCRERGIAIETRIEPKLPALAISDDALRQLLLNLLLNATEVTPDGGRILLSADWSRDAMNHLELRVEDAGPGIEPNLRTRIFEPFWTSRSDTPGGLGLAICKRIVEEAGGAIRVEDGSDGGACFRVELEIAR
jgi:signal transduction histidine kinase